MQNECVAASKKFGRDEKYSFYSAVSHLLQGHIQEAIRQLQPLQVRCFIYRHMSMKQSQTDVSFFCWH